MGIYLNPGNEIFRRIRRADIYVDKSGMINITNSLLDSDNNLICMSRPRRFGKTVAQNMLTAYYSKGCDSKELFEDLKIAGDKDFEENLNQYNVIAIDLNSEYQNTRDTSNLIDIVTDKIKAEFREQFTDIDFADNDSLAECMLKVYAKRSETFILIIDEYDVLVREQVDEELFNKYLSFLNGLFKSNTLRPAISFAYLTGILPIVRDKIQSKLNNFEEYTILDADEFAEYTGFTPDEVEALCGKHNMDYGECRNWYDGYSVNGFEIYSPESVAKAMKRKVYEGFWGKTSSYQVISDRINQNFEGTKDDVIRMLAGESVDVNVTRYLNTMDSFTSKNDAFTYLIHVGYLAYDREHKTCRIPNREVRQEWFNALEANDNYKVTDKIIKQSKALLVATLNGEADEVAKALDVSHIHVSSNRSYNNEGVLQSAIYLAYIYALNQYKVVKELPTGKGYADVTFLPYEKGMPAIVIELKHNKTVDTALEQIKAKKYFDSLDEYNGEILIVGINYDEKTKEHTCKIEKWSK